MIVWILLIVLGFVFLVKGADLLVEGASNFAKRFHIPEIIIGLTIVSIGTSLPELFVSITSAIDGYPDMAIGNVVGSNIVNMLFILGLSAIIKTITFQKTTRLIDIPVCLAVSILFMVLCNIGQDVTRIDALILIAVFIAFIAYTIVVAKKGDQLENEENKESDEDSKPKGSLIKNIIYMILGIVLLKFGGDFTVDNAVHIANFFGLSEKLIGVTILAVGTSLPELVTSVSAAIKGKSDIAIGNIIGSNIFNILFIIGASALIKPIVYNMSYNIDMIFVFLSTIILGIFPLLPPKNKMSRWNGIVFVLIYAIYIVTLLIK